MKPVSQQRSACRVRGLTLDTARTVGGVDEILMYLTSFMTLHPGDLVLTGFPAECARILPGDS